MKETTIIDPVHGFIRIPRGLLLDIVQHTAFNRLSRIKQLGLANVVYPGAQHTRLQHSLGAYHLASEAVRTLQRKGNFVFDSEAEAVQAAMLLHDIGHGPFSHVLENTLITGVDHEEISLMIMERMNEHMHGRLTLAIKIFLGDYPKRFLHQLISSQLDMDRLDYISRDAFFTGVEEGKIGTSRIIDMLDVQNDSLVIEKKGIYPVESYLVSRRVMYWQVYLHKTAVAAEHVLINCLMRAKYIASTPEGADTLFASPSLRFFLANNIDRERFFADPECLENYLALDDSDIYSALKVWSKHPDRVLSMLSRDFINRNIFKVEVSDVPFTEEYMAGRVSQIAANLNMTTDEARYLTSSLRVGKDMYKPDNLDRIEVVQSDGTSTDIATVSDMFDHDTLSRKIRKYYFCYHK